MLGLRGRDWLLVFRHFIVGLFAFAGLSALLGPAVFVLAVLLSCVPWMRLGSPPRGIFAVLLLSLDAVALALVAVAEQILDRGPPDGRIARRGLWGLAGWVSVFMGCYVTLVIWALESTLSALATPGSGGLAVVGMGTGIWPLALLAPLITLQVTWRATWALDAVRRGRRETPERPS